MSTAEPDAPVSPLFADVEVPTDSFSRRILDAAYEEFLSLGLRRTTIDQVAKRAKVGRMTVHRRFSSKDALIAAVVARENARIIEEVAGVAAAQDDVVDAITEAMAVGIPTLRHHPLVERLLETDREEIGPFLTFEAGPLVVQTVEFIAPFLSGLGGAESVTRAAEAIVRLCHSLVLVPQGALDLTETDRLREFLRPLLAALIATIE